MPKRQWIAYTAEPACDVLEGTAHFAVIAVETSYIFWWVFSKRDVFPVKSGIETGTVDEAKLTAELALLEVDG